MEGKRLADGLVWSLARACLLPLRTHHARAGGLAGAGRQVRAVDLGTGQVTIEYKGPQKLTYGLELTLKESPLIRQVTFV